MKSHYFSCPAKSFIFLIPIRLDKIIFRHKKINRLQASLFTEHLLKQVPPLKSKWLWLERMVSRDTKCTPASACHFGKGCNSTEAVCLTKIWVSERHLTTSLQSLGLKATKVSNIFLLCNLLLNHSTCIGHHLHE